MPELRTLILVHRFDDALDLSRSAARAALDAGDLRAWRRISCQGAAALYQLGRFEESVRSCDEVIASPGAVDDPGAVGHAWNISTIAAHRLSLPDVLYRLDEALLVGERLFDEQGRLDSLCRAAASAGTIGLAELGDAIFSEFMGHFDAGAAGDMSPGGVAYLKSQQILVRFWWALALEHEGDLRAVPLFASVAALAALPVLQDPAVLPKRSVAVFRAFEAFALVSSGRPARARVAFDAASAELSSGPFDMVGAALELLCGLTSLRLQPDPHDPASRPCVRHLRDLAQRCRDARIEAELWRLTAVQVAADGDLGEAAAARERFEALADGLDWRQRMQGAQVLQLRSVALRRAAEAAAQQ